MTKRNRTLYFILAFIAFWVVLKVSLDKYFERLDEQFTQAMTQQVVNPTVPNPPPTLKERGADFSYAPSPEKPVIQSSRSKELISPEDSMPDTTPENFKAVFSQRMGLRLLLPSNTKVQMNSFDEGRMLQGHIIFEDDPNVALGLYGYNGKVTEDQIKEFFLKETNSSADEWEEMKSENGLLKKGFGEERTFQLRHEDDDYTQYLVYGKGPGDKHFIFLVFGEGSAIDKKMETLKTFYDSLYVQ